MENKILVILSVPELDEKYDLMIPISRKVGNVIELIVKFLTEITDGEYSADKHKNLYNKENNQRYNNNSIVYETDIRNGTELIFL